MGGVVEGEWGEGRIVVCVWGGGRGGRGAVAMLPCPVCKTLVLRGRGGVCEREQCFSGGWVGGLTRFFPLTRFNCEQVVMGKMRRKNH